nr:DUF3413 domain-containing protein [uncultured Flavobacterium sp.]
MKKQGAFLKEAYLVFLFNLIVILFIANRYIDFLENTDGISTKVYLAINTFSHFFMIGVLPLLISSLVYLLSKSNLFSKIVHIVLSSFVIVFLKIDTLVFSQFRYHLSPIVLKMVFGKKSGDIFQFSPSNILMAVFSIIMLIGLQVLFFWLAKKIIAKEFHFRPKWVFSVFVLTILASHFTYAWASPNHYRPVTQFRNIFPVYFPLTADKILEKLSLIDHEQALVNDSFDLDNQNSTINYPLNPIETDGAADKKNILFIVIDSWQYKYLSPEITPNIYNFSKRCQVFNNHLSGSNMTTGGIFSIFYGVPATYFDTFTGQEIAPVFMNELQKQNYRLGIYTSATLENPPFNKNVFSKVPNLRLSSKGETPSERDLTMTNEWMASMNSNSAEKPFFGFLFFDSAHGFDHPKNYKSPFKPELDAVNYLDLDEDYNPAKLINRYKNSLHYNDFLIGKVLKQLEDKKLLESTIIVITSDHGQEFNDNKKGYWQHGGNFTNYQIHVPMMIFDPGKQPKTYTHQTLHYDISATLLADNFKVKNPFGDYSLGRNIYSTQKRDYFICGYNQKFAIIEDAKITTIQPSGVFDVTDRNLKRLDELSVNYNFVTKGIAETTKFYVKK